MLSKKHVVNQMKTVNEIFSNPITVLSEKHALKCNRLQSQAKKMEKKLPIGYYLKKADNLLTNGINNIHREYDINRTQWQILNSLNQNDRIDRNKLLETMREFANKEAIDNTIDTMITSKLINEENQLTPTEKGKDVFNKCLQKQKEFRHRSMNNISEQEYIQTITTLEKIIDNLKSH